MSYKSEEHYFFILKELLRKQEAGETLSDKERAVLKRLTEQKAQQDATDKHTYQLKKNMGYPEIQCYSYFDYNSKPISMWEWGYLFSMNRHVGKDVINGMRISTVWLGMEHGFVGALPLIYETMIFDESQKKKKSDLDEYQERYCTYAEALEGHKHAIKLVMSSI